MHNEPQTTNPREITFEGHAMPYMRQLYPFALRLAQQPCDAEDLMQETLTRAYVKFSQFTPGTNLRAWLYRIMLTTFYNTCRQRRRRPVEKLGPPPEPVSELTARTVPPARSAEAEALEYLGDGRAVVALAELPASFKSVIYLADIERYRYSEIAEVLGIPIGTVMSRAHRGRARMRSKLRADTGQAPRAA